MTAEQLQKIEGQGGCVDLSARTKLLLTGADRVRYLNGQVTNDVRKASAESALYACVTNVKGRIEADVFIHTAPGGEGLLVDAEEGLREALAMRLEKYMVADDVTLTDVTDEWRVMHCFGATGIELENGHVVNASRFGERGVDVWLPASSPMPPAPCPVLTFAEAETLRILRGIPRWPHELNGEAFPQEAGLEERAMDFAKGCYIGQEILSRIKMTGKMPRVLVRWEAQAGATLSGAGEGTRPLYYKDESGAVHEAGVVTSAAYHPLLDRWVGLGYVRHGLAQMHSMLLADGAEPNMRVDVNLLKT